MKRINVLLVFVFVLIISININAQITPPSIQWQKSLGGSSNEEAFCVKETQDKGYIVCGQCGSNNGNVTGNHGGTDCWVAKLDTGGVIQWQHSYGGSGFDRGNSIDATSDGGYIIACECTSNNGDVSGNNGGSDYWVFKIDSIGNIQWQRSYGGSGGDYAYAIQQTYDGGYIVAGLSGSSNGDVSGNHGAGDYWVIKLDTGGNIQWQHCYGGSSYDLAHAIMQTYDKGYIVGGWSESNNGDASGNHGNQDAWAVKTDSLGNLQWQTSVGGSQDEGVYSIIQDKEQNYIISGWTDSNDGDVSGNHGGADYWIVKLDVSGNLYWNKPFGGSQNDVAYSVKQTLIGGFGYIAGGYAKSTNGDVTSNHGDNDAWIIRFDPAFNIIWQTSLGGSGDDAAYSIIQTYDGRYVYAGWDASNNGDVIGNQGGVDYWVVKLGYNTTTEIENNFESSNVVIYPNPTNGKFTLQVPPTTKYIQISNTLGQIIEKRIVTNESEISFSINKSGIYFIQITTDKETITKKLVIRL